MPVTPSKLPSPRLSLETDRSDYHKRLSIDANMTRPNDYGTQSNFGARFVKTLGKRGSPIKINRSYHQESQEGVIEQYDRGRFKRTPNINEKAVLQKLYMEFR